MKLHSRNLKQTALNEIELIIEFFEGICSQEPLFLKNPCYYNSQHPCPSPPPKREKKFLPETLRFYPLYTAVVTSIFYNHVRVCTNTQLHNMRVRRAPTPKPKYRARFLASRARLLANTCDTVRGATPPKNYIVSTWVGKSTGGTDIICVQHHTFSGNVREHLFEGEQKETKREKCVTIRVWHFEQTKRKETAQNC